MNDHFLSYLGRRLLLGFVTLFVILLVSYVLMRIAPGDPTKNSMLTDGDGGIGMMSDEKPEQKRNPILEKQLNYDKPMIVGFALWLKQAATGDFGTSISVDKGCPVTALILERLPVTLKLNIWAILLTYLLAIPVGITMAVHPDTVYDKSMTVFLFLLYSLPSLWVALMLQAGLCSGGLWPVFPLNGLTPDIRPHMSTWLIQLKSALHYVLPVFCLAYGGFAGIARFTRAGMLDVIRQEFIRTARAKGVSEWRIYCVHAFRNALIIMITLFAGILPALVSGSILVEYIFNIPGMGALSMLALSSRDIPLMMALFAFGGILTLAGILLSDVLYVLADPRIGFESKTI